MRSDLFGFASSACADAHTQKTPSNAYPTVPRTAGTHTACMLNWADTSHRPTHYSVIPATPSPKHLETVSTNLSAS